MLSTVKSRILFAGAVFAAMLAWGGAQSAITYQDTVHLEPTSAQEMFADASYGVDPVVTGPVSRAFKQQQDDAGCESAVWPNIPTACFPR